MPRCPFIRHLAGLTRPEGGSYHRTGFRLYWCVYTCRNHRLKRGENFMELMIMCELFWTAVL